MYGVTVYLDRSYGSYSNTCALERRAPTIKSFKSRKLVTRFKSGCHGLHLDTGNFNPVGQQVSMEQLFCLRGSETAEKEHHLVFDRSAYCSVRLSQ